MPPSHSSIKLCEKMYTSLSKWGIGKKMFSMTLDNASANNCLLKGQLMSQGALDCKWILSHMLLHILNLMSQDGLMETDDPIEKLERVSNMLGAHKWGKKVSWMC